MLLDYRFVYYGILIVVAIETGMEIGCFLFVAAHWVSCEYLAGTGLWPRTHLSFRFNFTMYSALKFHYSYADL